MSQTKPEATLQLDGLSVREVGRPVNAHVVKFVREQQPDYAKMRSLIAGADAAARDKAR